MTITVAQRSGSYIPQPVPVLVPEPFIPLFLSISNGGTRETCKQVTNGVRFPPTTMRRMDIISPSTSGPGVPGDGCGDLLWSHAIASTL